LPGIFTTVREHADEIIRQGDGVPRCGVCGSPESEAWAEVWDAEYLTIADRFVQRRCLGCGVLFIDPVPSDRLAEIYPDNYYSFAPRDERSMVFAIKRRLDRRLFSGLLRQIRAASLSVLDVGGGSGWQLDLIRACDRRVTFTQVVDLDPVAAAAARAGGHEYYQGSIEDFQATRRFDLILLLNLLEHVRYPSRVLEKLRSALTPSGLILVQTPNYDSLDARLFRHRNWGGYHAPRHWVIFTRESLARIVNQAGLRIEKFTYVQGASFWSTSVLVLLARAGLVELTRERPAVNHPLFPPFAAIAAAFDLVRSPFAKLSQMQVVLRPK
jgi:2-polyprenyl-3-methyl-5-hydroxy-6-metoxy-1,4-benzoquinol methylase